MVMATGFPTANVVDATSRQWAKVVNSDRCTRCGGLMVAERCPDPLNETARIEGLALRCVQCGELIDLVILRNRQRQSARTVGSLRPAAKVQVSIEGG